MPPRWFCAIVIALWLLTSGKLLWDDLIPQLVPGTPPAYTIDLVEETETQNLFTPWTLSRGDEKLMQVRTRVERPSHNTFELSADYAPIERGSLVSIKGIRVRSMSSAYRVTAEGDLLGVRVRIVGQPDIPAWKGLNAEVDLNIDGEVIEGKMSPRIRGSMLGVEKKFDLPAVAVPRGGGLLQPLHPVNRIRNLHPGQAWTIRLFDPLADSVQSIQGLGAVPRLLRARVRDEAELLGEGKHKRERCHVIDYIGEDIEATTWVSIRTGLVLLQQVKFDKNIWSMHRD